MMSSINPKYSGQTDAQKQFLCSNTHSHLSDKKPIHPDFYRETIAFNVFNMITFT